MQSIMPHKFTFYQNYGQARKTKSTSLHFTKIMGKQEKQKADPKLCYEGSVFMFLKEMQLSKQEYPAEAEFEEHQRSQPQFPTS